MGWSEAEIICANHPDEIPQPGICPSCLRERLSRIIGKYSTNYDSFIPSSASPVYYYASSSAGSSPGRGRSERRHMRVASDVMDSIYVAFGGGGAGLKKSRSMVNYAAARDGGVTGNVNKKKKKKGGFWNKLMMRSSGKKSLLW
ncbi:hypothetical protein SASPL_145065 [Salvia splendens]|uniref:Uncharacterized protein n=1 Tax=Salvia splendens TaxID=180675 RepID=A0A8X8WI66_SALSN|nr:uncharacterized protein LOC121774276 [Salvia splendens]KAG6394479.1 hypothetical protein SASPL_145065 [Salvia splendens]